MEMTFGKSSRDSRRPWCRALFLALSYGFVPQVLDGKIVNQSDISGYVGMSHEMTEWNKAHPDNPTYWTDSMFGGMPTTAISTQNKGDYTQWIYDLLLTWESGLPAICSLPCWGRFCCSWRWG